MQRISKGRHVVYETTASTQQRLILCTQYALADERLSVLTGLVSHYLVPNRVCEQYGECNFPVLGDAGIVNKAGQLVSDCLWSFDLHHMSCFSYARVGKSQFGVNCPVDKSRWPGTLDFRISA